MLKCCLLFLSALTLVFGQERKPKIVTVYPTTDSIPVNVLRFYITFSKPMQEMDILKHIQLKNEEGKNITGIFFENQYELWNKNRTEVTLIVDPGRVKLGLFANNTLGRAFDEGKKYQLTIDSLLLDFDNQKLEKNFTKTFVAIKEDKNPPDCKLWQLDLPKPNSRQAIWIDFKDKIDHVSAQSLLKIFKEKKEIQGKIALDNEEQVAQFTPDKKWKKGAYQVIVSPRLEDISANTINQIFDHKPSEYRQNNHNFNINFVLE